LQVVSKAPPVEEEMPHLCFEVSALEAALEAVKKQLEKLASGMAGKGVAHRSLRDIDAAVRARGVQYGLVVFLALPHFAGL
jgi:hypothetical protein